MSSCDRSIIKIALQKKITTEIIIILFLFFFIIIFLFPNTKIHSNSKYDLFEYGGNVNKLKMHLKFQDKVYHSIHSEKNEVFKDDKLLIGEEKESEIWIDISDNSFKSLSKDLSFKELFKRKFLASIVDYWYVNLFILVPFVYLSAVILGTVFYYFNNAWDLPTSYFFAVQTLLAIGFGVPTEANDLSYLFSSFYLLLGSSIILGTLIYTANLVFTYSEEKARSQELILNQEDVNNNSLYNFLLVKNFSAFATFLAFLCWVMLGATYAFIFEGFDIFKSIYFIISALSGCGNVAPSCIATTGATCSLEGRGYFWGSYMLIGVPLYAVNMGQLAYVIVSGYMKNNKRILFLKPWDSVEYNYVGEVLHVNQHDNHQTQKGMNFSDFLVMEMLRIGNLDNSQIHALKELYLALDRDKKGLLSFEELQKIETFSKS